MRESNMPHAHSHSQREHSFTLRRRERERQVIHTHAVKLTHSYTRECESTEGERGWKSRITLKKAKRTHSEINRVGSSQRRRRERERERICITKNCFTLNHRHSKCEDTSPVCCVSENTVDSSNALPLVVLDALSVKLCHRRFSRLSLSLSSLEQSFLPEIHQQKQQQQRRRKKRDGWRERVKERKRERRNDAKSHLIECLIWQIEMNERVIC